MRRVNHGKTKSTRTGYICSLDCLNKSDLPADQTTAPHCMSHRAVSKAWPSPEAVFDRLLGTWAIQRTIEGQATMDGTARFTPLDTGALRYREEGRLRLADGHEFDAHKEYVFERAPLGFTVHFAETPLRLFHSIMLRTEGDALKGSATHLCTPDTYYSRYSFDADGSFTVQHVVHGPRKDYVSTTMFRRHD